MVRVYLRHPLKNSCRHNHLAVKIVVGTTTACRTRNRQQRFFENAMPTYTVTSCIQGLTQVAKQAIAWEITQAHHGATGAQRFFAEVIFRSVHSDDFFIGGKPLNGSSIFIHGHIRAGRTVAQKHELMMNIVQSISKAAGIPTRSIWVYISDLPPTSMVEFGHVLPSPGEETSWLENLPQDVRDYLLQLEG